MFVIICTAFSDILNIYLVEDFGLIAACSNFTPQDIEMAARRLSCIVKKMLHPVILNNLNS